jgi:aminoglycoside 6'-N-acetyltransferase I
MSGRWSIREADAGLADDWASLRAALWPEADSAEHALEIRQQLGRPECMRAFVAADVDGAVVGFAEAALRVDPVNGADTSPVGFLEGLYVRPESRRQGIGRALVQAVEQWTRSLGCRELASDALLDNAAGHAAHVAYGFEETERVVYFLKRLD